MNQYLECRIMLLRLRLARVLAQATHWLYLHVKRFADRTGRESIELAERILAQDGIQDGT